MPQCKNDSVKQENDVNDFFQKNSGDASSSENWGTSFTRVPLQSTTSMELDKMQSDNGYIDVPHQGQVRGRW